MENCRGVCKREFIGEMGKFGDMELGRRVEVKKEGREGILMQEQGQEKNGGIEERRKSIDDKVNREGIWLIDKLEEVMWYIFNGCGWKRHGYILEGGGNQC